MIISRTPLRVSFVGGGTDLKAFYSKEYGRVLSAAIDKYIYVAVKRQLTYVEHNYRISYSQVEFRDKVEDIQHPIVREALKLLEIDFPVEITTFADVPANTGLGSSSTFAVGLIHALHALKGQVCTKFKLASTAAKIEVDILKRNMGAQDHFAAAYGNLNVFTFHENGNVTVDPVFYNPEGKKILFENLMMFYTGIKRDASEVLEHQSEETENKFSVLREMRDFVIPLQEVLASGKNIDDVGKILHESWLLKRSITNKISSNAIDQYYDKAIEAGALGGKLLGAGGGGFLLFYVRPEKQNSVAKALKELYQLRFGPDDGGSRITYYDERLS